MRIYLTHCCAEKDPALRGTGKVVTPDKLYTGTPTREFMERCRRGNVTWAILSDLYGVWFPDVQHEWYEKDPDSLTEAEFERLRSSFDEQLAAFREIWFYYPDSVHPFHRRLLSETALAEKVRMIRHLSEIV